MTATLQEAEKLRQRLAALTTTELRQLIGSYSAIVGLLEKFDGFRHNVLTEEADLSDAEKFLDAFEVFRKIIGDTDDPSPKARLLGQSRRAWLEEERKCLDLQKGPYR